MHNDFLQLLRGGAAKLPDTKKMIEEGIPGTWRNFWQVSKVGIFEPSKITGNTVFHILVEENIVAKVLQDINTSLTRKAFVDREGLVITDSFWVTQINSSNNKGFKPLESAIAKGSLESVTTLIGAGARCDSISPRALKSLSESDNPNKFLLACVDTDDLPNFLKLSRADKAIVRRNVAELQNALQGGEKISPIALSGLIQAGNAAEFLSECLKLNITEIFNALCDGSKDPISSTNYNAFLMNGRQDILGLIRTDANKYKDIFKAFFAASPTELRIHYNDEQEKTKTQSLVSSKEFMKSSSAQKHAKLEARAMEILGLTPKAEAEAPASVANYANESKQDGSAAAQPLEVIQQPPSDAIDIAKPVRKVLGSLNPNTSSTAPVSVAAKKHAEPLEQEIVNKICKAVVKIVKAQKPADGEHFQNIPALEVMLTFLDRFDNASKLIQQLIPDHYGISKTAFYHKLFATYESETIWMAAAKCNYTGRIVTDLISYKPLGVEFHNSLFENRISYQSSKEGHITLAPINFLLKRAETILASDKDQDIKTKFVSYVKCLEFMVKNKLAFAAMTGKDDYTKLLKLVNALNELGSEINLGHLSDKAYRDIQDQFGSDGASDTSTKAASCFTAAGASVRSVVSVIYQQYPDLAELRDQVNLTFANPEYYADTQSAPIESAAAGVDSGLFDS